MADKKVDRYRPERVLDPTQQQRSALSNTGSLNTADTKRGKGRSALFDKFRRREERWRREQSLHDRESTDVAGLLHHQGDSPPNGSAEDQGDGKGGAK